MESLDDDLGDLDALFTETGQDNGLDALISEGLQYWPVREGFTLGAQDLHVVDRSGLGQGDPLRQENQGQMTYYGPGSTTGYPGGASVSGKVCKRGFSLSISLDPLSNRRCTISKGPLLVFQFIDFFP